MIIEFKDWIKEKLYNLKGYTEPRLIVTHPLRTFLFSIFVGPFLLGLFMIGVVGTVGLLISPFGLLFRVTEFKFSEPAVFFRFIAIWVFGLALSVTSFYLSAAGLSIYCSELFYSTILLFKGKLATGKIIKIWETSTRSGNSTTRSKHCTIQYTIPQMNKIYSESGSSQISFMQNLFEIELTLDRNVTIVYNPKNPVMARLIHK